MVACKGYTGHDHLDANKILLSMCGKNTDHHLSLTKTPFQFDKRCAVAESKQVKLEVPCKEYTAHDHLEVNRIRGGIGCKYTEHQVSSVNTPFQVDSWQTGTERK